MPMSCVQGGSSTEIVQLRIRCTSFIGASIVWIVLPVAASAASFDCSQAKTAMEEVVCSEPSLSKADGDLATAYEILLDKLSPEGRRAMTESQRRWLHQVRSICQAPEITVGACLGDYVERLAELRQSVASPPSYVWTRLFSYKKAMAPDESDDNKPRLTETEVDYPQIDHPLDGNARRINSMIASKAGEPECGAPKKDSGKGDGNGEIVGVLHLQTERLISVSGYTSYYCFGMAHPQTYQWYVSLALQPKLHPVQANDIFINGSKWKSLLQQLADKNNKASDFSEYGDRANSMRDEFHAEVVDPQNWILTPEGIAFSFGPYAFGGGYPEHADFSISWHEFKSVLISNFTAK